MERLTKISLDLAAVALMHSAAVDYLKIIRLQERLHDKPKARPELEGALEYVLAELKEKIGLE